MAAVEKKFNMKKELMKAIRSNEKEVREIVQQLGDMRKLTTLEEFKAEVCTRLGDLYQSVALMEREVISGYAQDKENLDNLTAVLKKARQQDRKEFKNLAHNDRVMHKWLGDMADMAMTTSIVVFNLQHKRGITEQEVRDIARKYHIIPDFLDDPKGPWKRGLGLEQLQAAADKAEEVKP
ncbi:MAG: hypothetical protein CVU64_03160 [Deltaproteobacteria bacterium HGW-Deltaproteobacteria-21]|jgi:predicted Zn-dependent protease with MMP-like domain|nr:MAG: hypothetical protein CVU64_03160 [Deltaproteobacteria bacterium HGW-Deltaproteobacteria-21]